MPPVIGICPLYDAKLSSYWMLPEYMRMLEAAGAVPVMMPLTDTPAVLTPLFDQGRRTTVVTFRQKTVEPLS